MPGRALKHASKTIVASTTILSLAALLAVLLFQDDIESLINFRHLPSTARPTQLKNNTWKYKHKMLVQRAQSANVEIAFFGDSITEYMTPALIKKADFGLSADAFGISGDGTENLLWRLRNGELDFRMCQPKIIILLIGTNNLSVWPAHPASTEDEIVTGIEACIEAINKRQKNSKILLLGLLPRAEDPHDHLRKQVSIINEKLKCLAESASLQNCAPGLARQQVYFCDPGLTLVEEDGRISKAIMPDFLHPSALGYERLFKSVKEKLASMH